MNRLFWIFMCIVLTINIQAKTTYIPFYSGSISITENGITRSVEGQTNSLSIYSGDNGIKFTIIHEMVTKDKVKSIKSAKSNVGWTAFAAGFAQGNGTTEAVSSNTMINTAKDAADDAQQLSIELLIENNSDEDIFVGDMNKGLSYWHIPSKGNLTINLNNPDWLQFRVSNAYIYDNNIERASDWKQKVCYVSVAGSGYVEKKNVEFEDENQIIYYNIIGKLTPDSDPDSNKEFIQFDKNTGLGTEITREEIDKIKKQKK